MGKQEDLLPLTADEVFRTHIILLLSSSHGHVQFHPSLVLPVELINFSHYFPPAGLHLCIFLLDSRGKSLIGLIVFSVLGRWIMSNNPYLVIQPETFGRHPFPVPWVTSSSSRNSLGLLP